PHRRRSPAQRHGQGDQAARGQLVRRYRAAVSNVTVEISDHIAVVTLDRPPVNAVDHATLHELTDAFRGLDDDRDVRVAIFTAAGDRAFMAGLDLRAAAPNADAVPARFVTDPGLVAREP